MAGEIEALHPRRRTPAADGATAAALERARLERELAEAEGWLAAARDRLADEAFLAKAPPAVVEGARAREAELADQVDRLRDRLRRADAGRRTAEEERPAGPGRVVPVSPSRRRP